MSEIQPVYSNPFVDTIDYDTPYATFKTIVLAPIAAIRILLIFCEGVFIIVCSHVLNLQQLKWVCAHIGLMFMYAFGFYNIKIKNKHYLKEAERENAIAVYNHVSAMDGIILVACVHPFSAVINKVHGSSFVLSGMAKKFHYILVDNIGNSGGATEQIRQHCEERRNMLMIAPEGANSNGHALLKFKTGAFVHKRPILPIIIRYPHKYANPAWTITDIRLTMWRLLTQFTNYCEIDLLPLIYPADDDTPATFAERVRAQMSKASGLPMVDYTRADRLELIANLGKSKVV